MIGFKPAKQFRWAWIAFPRGLKFTHAYRLSRGEPRGNDNVRRSLRMIAPNPKAQWLPSIRDGQYARRFIAITQGSKRDTIPPLKFIGINTLVQWWRHFIMPLSHQPKHESDYRTGDRVLLCVLLMRKICHFTGKFVQHLSLYDGAVKPKL